LTTRLFVRIENFGFKEEFTRKLQSVISSLTKEEFEKLMIYITGAICYSDNIIFQLTNEQAFAAHTCANTFDIPKILEEEDEEFLKSSIIALL
jgi:hypothetical protein